MSNKNTRILSVLLAVLMLVTTIPFTSIAAEDTTGETTTDPEYYVLGAEDFTLSNALSAFGMTFTYNELWGVKTAHIANAAAIGDNNRFYVKFSNTSISIDDYPYIAVGAMGSKLPSTGLNWDTTTSPGGRLWSRSFLPAQNGKIEKLIIDVPGYTSGNGGGYSSKTGKNAVYTQFEIRPGNQGNSSVAGSSVSFQYIAFFKTREAAESYVYPVEKRTVTFVSEGEEFAQVKYELGQPLAWPDEEPSVAGKPFKAWDVPEGTIVSDNMTVNAEFFEAQKVYLPDDISINNASGYNAPVKLTRVLPFWRMSNGSTTNQQDNQRHEISVVNDDVLLENTRYVKIRYRANTDEGLALYMAPIVDGVRLYDVKIPDFVCDNEWHELIYDIAAYNYSGGGEPHHSNVNTGNAESDWNYLKTHRFTGLILRPFGYLTTSSTNRIFDISGIALFDSLEDAEFFTFPVETATITYKNGDEEFYTEEVPVPSVIKYPEEQPTMEGMYFVGWDKAEGIDILEDTVINATYSSTPAADHFVFDANSFTASKGGYVSTYEYVPLTVNEFGHWHYTTTYYNGFYDASRAHVVFNDSNFPDYFSIHDYPIVRIDYRTNLTGAAALNYVPVYGRLWGVPNNTFSATGEWSQLVYDLSKATGGNGNESNVWKGMTVTAVEMYTYFADGKIRSLFVRPDKGTTDDGYIDIAHVGFFKTVEEANAYEYVLPELETYTVKFMDGETEIYSYEAIKGDSLVCPEAPAKPGYGFAGWDAEEGIEIIEDLTVNAIYKLPKALFDITNYSKTAGGSYIPIKPMTDTETGYDFYRIYESISTPFASVDGSRAALYTPADQEYDVSKDKYVAFGYRTNIDQNRGSVGLNMVINGVRLWSAKHESIADGQWHNAVINFDTFSGGSYGSGHTADEYRYGKMTEMQIRPHGANAGYNIESGDYYDTLYMAIFDDETAAKNYVYPGNEIEKDTYTVKFYEADKTTLISEHEVKAGYILPTPAMTYDDGRVHLGWRHLNSAGLAYADDTPALINADEEFYALTFDDLTASDDYKQYITDRADLVNVYNKIKTNKKLTVGYIGGSVTAGAGATANHSWRERLTTKLKSYATITEVNAAIGGSGSRAGAFRVDTDLIAQNPDLVFVEFVVNDGYCKETNDSAAKYYETVLRKIRMALPATEIIAIFTTNDAMAQKGTDSLQSFAVTHDAVAAHYGVTSIDVGRALVDAMGGHNSERWNYYFTDSVHPSDRGYRIYTDIIFKYIKDEIEAIEAAGGAATTTYSAPEEFYSKAAEIFATEVIKVTDTEKVTHTGFTLTEVDSKGNAVYVLSNTKIPGYISPTSAGAEVEVTFTGTELNVFMDFASSNAQITYSVDGGEPVAKTLSDTNHPLQLVSNLTNTEHTVKITFVNAYNNVKIGAFFVGSVNVGDLTVTYMDGETEVATQTYAYGEKLVHPVYEITPSETPGNIRKWSVPEGTVVIEDITVTITDAPVAPIAIASGRDMRFKFNSDNVPGIFMRGRGFTKGEVTYEANGDSYTETLYDPEFAFKPETGNWLFKENVNGWYRADGSQYITAYLNASSASKYIAIGYKLHAPNGVYEKGITVNTDTGSVTVPATYVNTGEYTTLILEITDLPAGAKNIRSLKIHPWSDAVDPASTTGAKLPVAKGSYFDLYYIAAFESQAEAEAYVPAAYVAPEQYDITINADANATITVDDVSITDTFTAKYYEGENVYITVTPNIGYKFMGWSDGNEIVIPDGTQFIWGRDDNKSYTLNGAVFAVDGAFTLTPVFEEIKHTVTFIHGEEIIETKEYREGTALVYPEYDVPASDKEGYVCIWNVEEGTPVMGAITVTVIEKEIAPVAVRAGEDIKFTFNTFGYPINFYGIYGTIQKKDQTVTANGDSYTEILYELNSAFNYETGLWEMYENISGNYEPDPGNFVTAIVNLPANTKYITLGVSVKAVETKAFVGNLEVTSDKGTIEIPVDFTGIDGDIAKFVLDVRSLPADSTNIRSIKIWPWQKEKDKTHIKPGSFIKIEHIAGFETLAEANAYEYSYTAPEKYAVSLDATEGGSFTVDKVGPKTEYSAEHYENEIVFLTATADAGYTFAGWYNGEEKVTGDYATTWYSKDSKDSIITVTGDAFKVTDALTLTAKFEPIYRNLEVKAIGENQAEEKATFTVNGGEPISTYVGDAHEAHYTELVAIAPAGLKFEGWYNITEGRNILLARTEELSLYITGDMQIEARFMDETISMPVRLSVSIGAEDAGGTIKIQGDDDAKEDFFDYVSSGRPTTITAVPDEGNKVGYWVRVTGTNGATVLMSTSDSLDAYPLGNEVTYLPVFFEQDDQVKLYVDYANKVIATIVNDSEAAEPEIPSRIGYVEDKWVPGETVNGITVYRATYTKPEAGIYALTIKYADGTEVTYGDGDATYPALKYNDQVTLTTDATSVAWTITEINGEKANIVMSYKNEYTFNYSFTNNMVIEEKTAGSADVALDTVEAIYDSEAGLIKFVGVFELPEGAAHVDHGILLTANAEIGESDEAFKLNTGADIIVGRIRNNTNPTPAFVINKNNVEGGTTWYGRAYLVYTIGEETFEVYGDTISCKAE